MQTNSKLRLQDPPPPVVGLEVPASYTDPLIEVYTDRLDLLPSYPRTPLTIYSAAILLQAPNEIQPKPSSKCRRKPEHRILIQTLSWFVTHAKVCHTFPISIVNPWNYFNFCCHTLPISSVNPWNYFNGGTTSTLTYDPFNTVLYTCIYCTLAIQLYIASPPLITSPSLQTIHIIINASWTPTYFRCGHMKKSPTFFIYIYTVNYSGVLLSLNIELIFLILLRILIL